MLSSRGTPILGADRFLAELAVAGRAAIGAANTELQAARGPLHERFLKRRELRGELVQHERGSRGQLADPGRPSAGPASPWPTAVPAATCPPSAEISPASRAASGVRTRTDFSVPREITSAVLAAAISLPRPITIR